MLKNKSQSKINDVLSSPVKHLNNVVDVNTIVGNPINNGKDIIIPISKITTCFLGGGGEYGKVKIFDKSKAHPFAGGSGAIVNVAPTGFLICKNGNYEFVKSSPDTFDKVAEKTIDLVQKISEGM